MLGCRRLRLCMRGRHLRTQNAAASRRDCPMSDSAPPPDQVVEVTDRPVHKHKWYFDALELWRALAGLPVLASLLLEVFSARTKFIGTLGAFVVALILRFFPTVREFLIPSKGHAIWNALPWFISSILALLLVFKIIPDRSQERDAAIAQKDSIIQQKDKQIQQNALLTQEWLSWQQEVEKAANKCAEQTQKVDQARVAKAHNDEVAAEKARDICLTDRMGGVLGARNRPDAGVAGELMAGHILLANPNTSQALWDRLSVDQHFLGEGYSVPQGGDVDRARVPEYLVRNLSEQSPRIWHWEMDEALLLNQRPVLESNLLSVLHGIPPVNHADFEKNWSWLKEHLRDENEPLLVRFQLLPGDSSGCIGRRSASRVFMSNLGELASRTVAEASRSTGFIVSVKGGEAGVKLHIWVFAPPESNDVTRATWRGVLKNFSGWIGDEPCIVEK
jgi:hypothetical protein